MAALDHRLEPDHRPDRERREGLAPLKIPSGCTITDLEVIVRSNAARSSLNGWVAKLFTQTHDWSTLVR